MKRSAVSSPTSRKRGPVSRRPGYPPLLRGAPWWHEVKRPKGKQSVQQRAWQQMCEVRHVAYVCGGVQEALEHLREIGVIR